MQDGGRDWSDVCTDQGTPGVAGSNRKPGGKPGSREGGWGAEGSPELGGKLGSGGKPGAGREAGELGGKLGS